jgi:hydroxyacylglutathione hydrolase
MATIAVVGGGVSGALTAFHLMREGVDARVVLIEPEQEIGRGLAYSTPSLRHLLNVPAGKISALPEDAGHFLRWLHSNGFPEAKADTFAPRRVFGGYVQSLIGALDGVQRVRGEVVDATMRDGRAVLRLKDGRTQTADAVVLALGNFAPARLRGVTEEAEAAGVYCQDAWNPATYAGLAKEAPVTLIGSGLTAVDVVLRLREQGHRGVITMLSRHGVLPNRHAQYRAIGAPAIPAGTPATARAYLHALREAIANGVDWRAAIDSLRAVTNELWLALPLEEQRRFRRHLQRRWDVVRHRMAPEIAAAVDRELASGGLVVVEGSLKSVTVRGEMACVTASDGSRHLAARVINCTGPSMDYRRVGSPLLDSLFAQGAISAGALGGGFAVDATGAVKDAQGVASPLFFSVGPGRLGTLLESIAVPEIREQAWSLAKHLAARFPFTLESAA